MKIKIYSLTNIAFIFSGLLLCSAHIAYGQHNPTLGYGNGYVNLSKKSTGGAVQKGDILEIRTTYFLGPTYNIANKLVNGNAYKIWNVRYYDSVPTKTTMNTGAADSLRLITNEGLTIQNYTLAAGDDAGVYDPGPGTGKYQVRMNIGTNSADPGSNASVLSDNTKSGFILIGGYVPKIFGGTLLTTAFRVTVTGNAGDTITLGVGKLVYRKTSSGADTVINAQPYKILIDSTATSLCANALGNNLAVEASGTFDSGYIQNRTYGPAFLIPDYSYLSTSRSVAIGDGSYAIVNNSSPTGSTNANARMQPFCTTPSAIPTADSCVNRMFGGFWDIIGDHTGTNNAIGNPAPAPGKKGGYMLMVNADVPTSEAYRQTVSGLCPDTYYEFSAWVKNICKRCGIDQYSVSTYTPGVRPNLTFTINDIDLYSSGELDTVGWVKKGFVFKTGASQTSAVISIRNNAPGGGGNDWVLDDLALGTCGPSSVMNYKPIALGCSTGTQLTFTDTVRYSYNPKYSFYKWQSSTDGGVTWGTPTQATANSGSIIIGPPVNGKFQYIASFGPITVNHADSGHLYRVVLGTSNANVNSKSCSFTDGNYIMVKVISCPAVLEANIISFSGKLNNENKTVLNWVVSNEINLSKYEIEKSSDGVHFTKAAEKPSGNSTNFNALYLIDNEVIKTDTYYRLLLIRTDGSLKYSETILITPKRASFEVLGYTNPFTNFISIKYSLPRAGSVSFFITDAMGQPVYKQMINGKEEQNMFTLSNLDFLPAGVYSVTIIYEKTSVTKRMLKIE